MSAALAEFERALYYISNAKTNEGGGTADNAAKLQMYATFNQIRKGACSGAAPSRLQVVACVAVLRRPRGAWCGRVRASARAPTRADALPGAPAF